MTFREVGKRAGYALATIAVAPALLSFVVRAKLLGPDRAVQGSSQALALWPGLPGVYLRRAFYARVLARCHPTVTIEFGTIFSKTGACLEENVYIGPRCHIGLALIERDVLLAAGVHVPSGARTHGTGEIDSPIREQPGDLQRVRIGAGTWVGSAAVVMADVGERCVIGAGAVVTHPVPDTVIAAGVPARVIRERTATAVIAGMDVARDISNP